MRVGVVAAAYGDPSDERALIARRLAGALACAADVDVLVPGGDVRTDELDGAVHVVRFPSKPADLARRSAWHRVALGADMSAEGPFRCSCLRLRRRQEPLPAFVEEQLLVAEGGDAPDLYTFLRAMPYDVVVIVGLHSPAAYWGVKNLPDDRRLVLVPAAVEEELIWLELHSATLERAERVVVFTKGEQATWTQRLAKDAGKIEHIRFLVGVNPLARDTDPQDAGSGRYVILPGDWIKRPISASLARWAERLERDVNPDVKLRIVGPGAERSPLGLPATGSRLDIWRWMSRAMAVFDPTPRRLLGVRVLEAFLYRTPVIVHARGGANREHAEAGGGLWFRTDDEFYAVARALLDDDLARVLGEQGGSYAEEHYGETDSFIKRVGETFLS